jgi:hypothetical protein
MLVVMFNHCSLSVDIVIITETYHKSIYVSSTCGCIARYGQHRTM